MSIVLGKITVNGELHAIARVYCKGEIWTCTAISI